MRSIGRALYKTPEWRVLASCSDMRDWTKLWEDSGEEQMRDWWHQNVAQIDKCPVVLCGSHAGHTLFLLKQVARE